MARYTYQCETCGQVEDFDIPMAEPKTPRACVADGCKGQMIRRFRPYTLTWRDSFGQPLRAPSKGWDWEDGRPVELAEFHRRNPGAGSVGSTPRG